MHSGDYHDRRRGLPVVWARGRAVVALVSVAALLALASPAAAGASGWSKPVRYGPIEDGASLSCAPATSFCMVVGFEVAYAMSYKNGEWKGPILPEEGTDPFVSVSCPSEEFCLAITPTHGVIYEKGSWGKTFTVDPAVSGGNDLRSVSCTKSTFCLAVGIGGKVFSYDGTVWTGPVHVANGRELNSVSCFSTSFCVVGGKEGYVAVYNGSSWLSPSPSVDTVGSFITSVSCGSPTFCAAGDNSGDVLTYSGGEWSAPLLLVGPSQGVAISCPSASFCGAVSGDGYGWTFNGSSWTTPVKVDSAAVVNGVSCASSTFCLAVDNAGNYFTYTGPPEFGRCLKQTKKAVSSFDSAKCTKLASEDSGTEAEKLKKGNYRWTSGVVKAKFTTVLKSGTVATLESVGGTKITCTGETSTGEYVGTSEIGKLIAKFAGCESSSGKCSSSGKGAGEIDTHSLGGSIGFETEVVPPAKDHIAEQLNSESGNVVEFACGGVSVVVRGSLLHKIAANAMKLTATEKFTASKGKQKPEHFAGGVPKEHVLEVSTNGGAFEQAGWTFSETLTNEEKVEASTIN
jgi:hypothetical protein